MKKQCTKSTRNAKIKIFKVHLDKKRNWLERIEIKFFKTSD